MLAEARIHIYFDVRCVDHNILQDTLLDRPPEEVQLAHRRLFDRRGAGYDETDALPTTEGVKQLLAVRLEFALVLKMDDELAFVENIGNIELFGVVRDEPLDDTETDGSTAIQEGENSLNTPGLVIELLEPTNNIVLFALDAVLEGVPGGLHPC